MEVEEDKGGGFYEIENVMTFKDNENMFADIAILIPEISDSALREKMQNIMLI